MIRIFRAFYIWQKHRDFRNSIALKMSRGPLAIGVTAGLAFAMVFTTLAGGILFAANLRQHLQRKPDAE